MRMICAMKYKWSIVNVRWLMVIGLSFVICHLSFSPLRAQNVTKAEADSAYARQQYQQAIRDYEALLTEGVSAELYYNLGNAYYRSENITRAIINYERALLLSPGDGDIRHNLRIARQKTVDKVVPSSEFFVVTWYRALSNLMGVDSWGWMALVTLALGLLLMLLYLFSSRVALQKVGFFGTVVMVALFLLSSLFAYQQKRMLSHRTGAIITQSAVTVKSTPAANGTELFVLHEGTRVDIIDDTMKDWKEVRLPDGKEGWMETKAMEVI